MGTRGAVSKRVKWVGIVLIAVTGLLNFHIPHFLIESPTSTGDASHILELVLLANLVGALVAAVGIYRATRWAWLLGMLVASLSFLLYLAQETVGLPGLPKMWLEPSRIVALVVEGLFVIWARFQGVDFERERAGAVGSESFR